MSKDFETQLNLLRTKYGSLTMAERRRILEKVRRKNLFSYRKLERLKHELLRLEAKRAQLELEEEPGELTELEQKIVARKEIFLKLLCEFKQKE
ncbi:MULTISPECIES: AAA family ATPase [Enterococcus]|uniref:AAA family ATPase n=1 Tax=Enterococcus TaxID=1350 RepID=UPI001E5231EA|nr:MULTISPECIES: AAA family ATPase [Enterococcus]MCD1023571.1 AAA family ATPase [Enterococcus sp. SMC-9]MDT2738597.1 AAA family ATPase [Enterococcus canintestini]WHA08327.1 AAA family ATPase [Enterococcus montenegrensis]